jgi:hypothetical protein
MVEIPVERAQEMRDELGRLRFIVEQVKALLPGWAKLCVDMEGTSGARWIENCAIEVTEIYQAAEEDAKPRELTPQEHIDIILEHAGAVGSALRRQQAESEPQHPVHRDMR